MKKTPSTRGKEAHFYTIVPSHDRYETQLRIKNKNKLVRSPKGLPDFVVHDKNTKFYELKPNRLWTKTKTAGGRMSPQGTESKYLNEDQERTIRRMLNEGVKNIFIVYYNKYKRKGHKKDFRFVFKEKRLSRKNLKEFCISTDFFERYDPDELFKR